MPTEKNFRHGHRDRVRARFLRNGLLSFADYEVLELLLFYAIPRRDTKEQAHALDDTFGSLYHALTADADALCRVPGIGERTALFLNAIWSFLEYVAHGEPHEGACTDKKMLAERIYPYLDRNAKQSSLIAFLSNRDEIICVHRLGKVKSLSHITTAEVISLAFSYRASTVVIVDYKATGIPFPSDATMQGIQRMKEEMATVGIYVRDYLAFTDTQYNSLFFLTGDRQFNARSPFFIDPDALALPRFKKESAEQLIRILSFVMNEEKATAFTERLLEKYGTLSSLLSLPYETLISENKEEIAAVMYLKILFEVHSRAGISRILAERVIYKSADEVGKMFSDAIGLNSVENIALATFDDEMRLINIEICNVGSVNTASFVMRNLVERARVHHASYAALAHNHPCGTPTPSTLDTGITMELARAFRQTRVKFIDHFVVTSFEYICISRRGLESYTDMPDSFFN